MQGLTNRYVRQTHTVRRIIHKDLRRFVRLINIVNYVQITQIGIGTGAVQGLHESQDDICVGLVAFTDNLHASVTAGSAGGGRLGKY